MGITAIADSPEAELCDALTRVAATPGLTHHLHEILGTYCHESRNLLNCLNMSLYLARRGADAGASTHWNEVENHYRSVERFLDRLQSICRPLPLSQVRLSLSLLFDERKAAWNDQLSLVGRSLVIEGPAVPTVGAFDPVRLGQAFDDLVAWRVRNGATGADLRIRWAAEAGQFRVVWDEPDQARHGDRSMGDSVEGTPEVDMLAVPLLTRIVTLHGGTLDVDNSDRWRLVLRWPLD